MKIFVFMGTHLPEIRHCMGFLAKEEESLEPLQFHLPEGLSWAGGEKLEVQSYDPDSVLWVFDPDSPGAAFILLDPRQSPVHQLEYLAGNLKKCLIEPVKIITLVNCAATGVNSKLRSYLDACIYYSDIILLGNRMDIPKSFTRDYEKHYERNCYPCLFMLLKGPGIPSHPQEILTPGTRRISQLFDLEGSLEDSALPGVVIEASCDLDMEEEEADPFRPPTDQQVAAAHIPDATPWIVPAGS